MIIHVIGAGSIGNRHAANLESLGISTSLISWRSDFADYSKTFYRNNPDYIFICTGTDIRLPLFKFCFEHDVPFFVEKPVAYRIEDLDYLYSLPKTFLSKCYVGYMQRYSPLVLHLLSLRLSPIHRCSFEFGHNVFKWRKNWNFSDSYASSALGGGVTLDLCHDIDLVNLLFDVRRVDSVICKDHATYPGIDFLSTINLSDDDGAYAALNLDYIRDEYTHRGFILSSTDSIYFDLASGVFHHNSCYRSFPPLTTPANRNKMFIDMIKHLFFREKPDLFIPQNLPTLLNTKNINYLIASIWSQRTFKTSISTSL